MLFIIILIICFLLQLSLPWWVITAVAFAAAFWRAKSSRHAFWSGFLAIFCLWAGVALFYTLPNNNILADRIGIMMGLPETSFTWLIVLLATGLAGALVSGLFALSGYYVRQLLVVQE